VFHAPGSLWGVYLQYPVREVSQPRVPTVENPGENTENTSEALIVAFILPGPDGELELHVSVEKQGCSPSPLESGLTVEGRLGVKESGRRCFTTLRRAHAALARSENSDDSGSLSRLPQDGVLQLPVVAPLGESPADQLE